MKRYYVCPAARTVSFGSDEAVMEGNPLPTSWAPGDGDLTIIEGDPEGDGKGVKEDKFKNLWDEVW